MADKPAWLDYWYTVQMPSIPKFGVHGGQWWVYRGESEKDARDGCGSPMLGYQGPPLSEETAKLAAGAPLQIQALVLLAADVAELLSFEERDLAHELMNEALSAVGLETRHQRSEALRQLLAALKSRPRT
jgi:hypothetical protein